MRLLKQILPLGAWLLLAASCTEGFEAPHIQGSSEGTLTVGFRVDGEMPVRSVLAQEHEVSLKEVCLLFFDESTNLFAGYSRVNVGDGQKTFSIDTPESLASGKSYRMLAVGNADTYAKDIETVIADFGKDTPVSYEEAMGSLTASHEGAVTAPEETTLPLFGKFVDKSTGRESLLTIKEEDGVKKIEEADDSEFLFSRAICRFDLLNLVPETLDIVCARVVNTPDKGYFFTDGLDVSEHIAPFSPQEAPDGKGYKGLTETGNDDTAQRIESKLYGFPNVVNPTVVNDKVTTALMIAGYYTDPATDVKDTDLTYYRFNLANLGEAQVLNRNYCYRATIKGVNRRGSATEKEAYDDSQPIFKYDFNPVWNSTDDNVATDNEGNFLIVNQTHLTFKGEAAEGDLIELHVSTNPNVEWDWRWDTSDWMPASGEDPYFSCQRVKGSSALRISPKAQNSDPYVRYGYIEIISRNKETGKELKLKVYLQQLSMSHNIMTLTVDGRTGKFEYEVDPYGSQSVDFLVVTGTPGIEWEAEDVEGDFKFWGSAGTTVSYTKKGNNGTFFTLLPPANISKIENTATVRFSLKNQPTNPDGSKPVPDVTVVFRQKPSSLLLSIVNKPLEGQSVEIDCLSFDYQHPNCVVNAKKFQVNLADKDNMLYRVKSDFDKNRDLKLAKTSLEPGQPKTAVSKHPTDGSVQTDDVLEDLASGETFYINPFRMGPGDYNIKGTITVEAYHKDDKNTVLASDAFPVRLYVSETKISDVILKQYIGSSIQHYLIADRNVGVDSRIREGMEDEEYVAGWATNLENVKIAGKNGHINPDYNQYYGDLTLYNDGKFSDSNKLQQVVTKFKSDNKLVGWPYEDVDWRLIWGGREMSSTEPLIWDQFNVSKGRTFARSIYDMEIDGKEIPVVCWFPLYHQTNYWDNPTTACFYAVGGAERDSYNFRETWFWVTLDNRPGTTAFATYNNNIAVLSFMGGAFPTPVRLIAPLSDEQVALYKETILKGKPGPASKPAKSVRSKR